METSEAFNTLIKSATAELKKIEQAGAAYFAAGDTSHVREAADRVEAIQALILSTHKLEDQWELVLSEPAPPTLSICETPPAPIPVPRPPPVLPTMQTSHHNRETFRLLILKTLVELGGRARTRDVLDEVGKKMQAVLNEADCEHVHGADIRWRNTARWSRQDMIAEGYLSAHLPRGTWEITEEGRKYLKNRGDGLKNA